MKAQLVQTYYSENWLVVARAFAAWHCRWGEAHGPAVPAVG